MKKEIEQFIQACNEKRSAFSKFTILESRAAEFAYEAHRDQTRRYRVDPYITHPAEVASITAQFTSNDKARAVAWLHDVIEDCSVSYLDLAGRFDYEIASDVQMLSNESQVNPEHKDKPRAVRKAIDREYAKHFSPTAKLVKLADIYSNLHSLVSNDPVFAEVWVEEKLLLLPYLTGSDSPELWGQVYSQVVLAKQFLAPRW